MKKKRLIFYYITLMLFCPVLPASALSNGQKNVIIDNCDIVKDSLKNVQKADSRARIFLGSHYETVLSKYIMPLNVRLLENNKSNAGLIENQKEFSEVKAGFTADYINYQQGLEELVAIDCRAEPERFYDKLVSVRTKRGKMVADVANMRKLINKNINLVKELAESL